MGTDYLYRDGLLLAAETQTGRRHFHLDHLGTPRLITRVSGDRAAYHVYYPFGEEATAFNQDGERMKFTGHERDLGSVAGAGDDLDYMHARHESPVTGRFLSTDRYDVLALQFGDRNDRKKYYEYIAHPQTWNRYTYTRGNPLKYVDPDGESAELALGTFFAGSETSAGGGLLAGGAGGAAPLVLAVAAGVGAGWAVNQIPGVSEALTVQQLSDALAGIFLSGQAGASRDFINAKVVTVLQRIAKYSAPDPRDPRDQSNKKNIYNRMKDHLKQARNKLKRLDGKTRQALEELIQRTESQLENWWSGGGA